ncbi:CPXCG motif-containing cysteine-rich protein [Pseudotamlana carrageenivorans]|uniref:CPXCG motif-containing cysteine-rich protein n=1 Tax=Pseudotamlana carrageenivorans TaxID=2069432 RepID=A0A2I7SER5_9FLAO|nr:CPXCG motif-containing cysteine-rich protein [Tamlana carrageenivorans]AUS04374.1 CPXCG motif-containing cysteine-rich protein [Tamlana carrageenivorans]
MIEYAFNCPYCWESISVLIDGSISKQKYIEDCEVCCNPIEISLKIFNSEVMDFQAHSREQ